MISFQPTPTTYDIPSLGTSAALGGRRLDVVKRPATELRTFAARVNDGASEATASLEVRLGDASLLIERRLKDLTLTSFQIDGESQATDERSYQTAVSTAAGVATFSDWILALRHLTFYFEDRQALIWDATAQRQLLRLLFLPPETSAEWTTQERAVLELDSLVRNLQYSLNKEERRLLQLQKSVAGGDEVKQSLELLQELQGVEQDQLDDLSDTLAEFSAKRSKARLDSLHVEQDLEEASRAVERLELQAVAAAFPDAPTTARYILGQIFAENSCITCGASVPEYRALLEQRLHDDQCLVCASPTARLGNERAHHPRLLRTARARVTTLKEQVGAAALARHEAEDEYEELLAQLATLTASTGARSAEIDDLVKRLPPDAREAQQQRGALASLRSSLEIRRAELNEARSEFAAFVKSVNKRISSQREAIKEAFDGYASGFLVEECELLWQPRRSRVGETGETVEFAAFELAMSGASFGTATRRQGPSQVSESQREFIDLSFRMALMKVATEGGASLVIDAPESSLDAVFVRRAAEVLTRFGVESGNRLLITSNMIDGDLIPSLLKRSGIHSNRDRRIIDLLSIAAPTAATRKLNDDYRRVRFELFDRARSADPR